MTLQSSRHDISIGPRPRPLRSVLRAVVIAALTVVFTTLAIAIAARLSA